MSSGWLCHTPPCFTRRWRPGITRLIVVSTLAGALLLPQGAHAARRRDCREEIVRVGLVYFDQSVARALTRYFSALSHRSQVDDVYSCRVSFDLVPGNAYQILAWLRTGELDGAVVSPFLASLFLNDSRSAGAPAVQFLQADTDIETATPLEPIAVVSSDGHSDSPTDPGAVFDAFLTDTLEVVRSPGKRPDGPRAYQLEMVSHLSSSGFIAPLIYAHRWLVAKTPGDPAKVAPLRRAFWAELLRSAHFGLPHAPDDGKEKHGPRVIRFWSSTPSGLASGKYKKYAPWLHLPNDVLVLSKVGERRMFGDKPDANYAEHLFPLVEGTLSPCGFYTAVAPIRTTPSVYGPPDGTWNSFMGAIRCLWGSDECTNTGLEELFQQWYLGDAYEFTIEETFTFIRDDQRRSQSDNLALVLPGGGVKAAYQAVLLDRLFGDGRKDPAASPLLATHSIAIDRATSPDVTSPEPLRVHAIIGTSGGALTALFAAFSTPPFHLADLWIRNGRVVASASQIFPFFGVLRFSSLVLLVLIFGFAVLFLPHPSDRPTPSRERRPGYLTGGSVLLMVLFPLLLRQVINLGTDRHIDVATRARLAEYVPWVEGLLYLATVAVLHCCLTCFSRQAPARSHRFLTIGGTGIAAGVLLVALGIFKSDSGRVLADQVWTATVIVALGGLVFAIGIGALLGSGRVLGGMIQVRDYLRAAVLLLSAIVITTVGLCIVAAAGGFDSLEVTASYWSGVLIASVIASGLIVWIGQPPAKFGAIGHWIAARLDFWRHRCKGYVRTPISSLMVMSFVGLLAWTALLAPALYDNVNALAYLNAQLQATQQSSGSDGPRTTLVVTGTSMESLRASNGTRTLPPGDVYFCLGDSCDRATLHPRWFSLTPEALKDAVFASGSPFPVLPGHSVSLPQKFSGTLIDGGYAHNVPIDAARATGAQQVLIIRSSPLEEPFVARPSRWASSLVTNSPKLFPLMFELSQAADRQVGQGLMVASLNPVADGTPFPSLVDFREQTIRLMADRANRDLNSRIGRVESWGPGRRERHVSAEDDPESGVHWTSGTECAISKLEEFPGKPGRSRVAVFSLDDVAIKNKMGEAMLYEMATSLPLMIARVDDERFWRLFPDAAAVRSMREYLQDLKTRKSPVPTFPLGAWKRWEDNRFIDYFVTFVGQYQDILKQQGPVAGARWLNSLFVGMSEDEVRQLAQRTWDEGNIRDLGRAPFSSLSGRRIEIPIGLRPYVEIKELVDMLQEKGWQTYLVSSSNQLGAEIAGVALGFDPDTIIGAVPKTRTRDRRYRAHALDPFPEGAGKVDALRARGLIDDGEPELVIAGGRGDLELLAISDQLSVFIDNHEIPLRTFASAEARSKSRGMWIRQPAFLGGTLDIESAASTGRLLAERAARSSIVDTP